MILKNCLIYDETTQKERLTDILFTDKILGVGENLSGILTEISAKTYSLKDLKSEDVNKINSEPETSIIDAGGVIAIPGGIDPHVHFDTPGYTEREDFYHGSMSAAAGGVTTVIDMPCTSVPPVTNAVSFDVKAQAVKSEAVTDYCFFGGVDARDFKPLEKNMRELLERGVKGFKTYFTSGMASYPRVTKFQFFKIMQKAKELNSLVLLHAEDYELIRELENELKDRPDDFNRYYMSRPAMAEILAVSHAVEITRAVQGRLHVVHVASSAAARIINDALGGLDISYETCPHYLYFTNKDYELKGSSLKTMPGVKDKADREWLWHYLKEGQCSFVASDHAPASLKEKSTGSFQMDYGGIPGTQTMIPLVFSEGYMKGRIGLKKLVEVTSRNAALRYNIYPKKGCMLKGSDADLTLLDKNESFTFRKEDLLSKGETSPFFGETFLGKVRLTILRGKIIYSSAGGIAVKKGYGRYL
ncbi:MAG: amidohydrolase family protein [Ignavibacteria bacterium]|jgi:allantoinase|nr:amidohydrolase family protein [Ignavibacteria bacterium]MCU7502309.1 amidohydrolase family protein [Ignavibacteria bacterium]MCU7516647.1 amidohydrolase family protein [Ignavibacteria bacterium]